ncbi:FG-GAP-like repeat-containing protein [Nannocystis radixulma]|uniref:FG-GAP-like repeat-containing protein n=1 Tax=Nannocystis radixulma TaxID=2995305 RepID=A0ABT5BPE2_9BACT|nr:FG-GAP-like repeat-containing protein [Nannocystis radixulma]MDC0676036.1 FG-GAP-like repeat-containing protein [Nannocystis radixulma]
MPVRRSFALALAAALACTPDTATTDTQGDTSAASTSTSDGVGASTTSGLTTTAAPTTTVDPTTTDPTTTTVDPTTTTVDSTTSDGTSTGTTDTTGEPLGPGCGDGLPAPGELCFKAIELEFLNFVDEVAFIDFDGDGHLDMLTLESLPLPLVPDPSLTPADPLPLEIPADVVGMSAVTFIVQFGDGEGGFTPGPEWHPLGYPDEMIFDEFTGDGVVDLFECGVNSDPSLSPGTGMGTFGPASAIPLPLKARGCDVGDIDGDGDLDLVAVDNGSFAVALGDGLGGFTTTLFPAANVIRDDVVLFDLDDDGHLDLVINRWGPDVDALETMFGVGDGTFSPGQLLTGTGQFSSMFVLDPADDGRPAVLVLSAEGPVSVLRSFTVADDGTLAEPQDVLTGDWSALAVRGRFDGDARLDVAQGGFSGFTAALGQDPWPPAPVPLSSAGVSDPRYIAVGDLNADNIDDLVIGGFPNTLLLSRP